MAEITDEAYLEQHPEHRELDQNIRAQLRQNAQLQADLDTERASRAELEKRVAFKDAGLTDAPERELFEQSYKGELTAEAIKEAAAKYPSLIPADGGGTQAPENRTDLDAIRRIQQASNGAPAGAPMDFGDALDRVRTVEEWDAVMASAPPESGIRSRGTIQGSRLI